MADPTGEAGSAALRLDFDRRLMLQFRGSAITSDAGLLPYRELDDAFGLTDRGGDTLADTRSGNPLAGKSGESGKVSARGIFYSNCETPHTARPIPQRCCRACADGPSIWEMSAEREAHRRRSDQTR